MFMWHIIGGEPQPHSYPRRVRRVPVRHSLWVHTGGVLLDTIRKLLITEFTCMKALTRCTQVPRTTRGSWNKASRALYRTRMLTPQEFEKL